MYGFLCVLCVCVCLERRKHIGSPVAGFTDGCYLPDMSTAD